MELIKENSKGKTYQSDNFKVLYRNKDSIAGDNEINPKEIIYFITGEAEITLENKIWKINSPTKVEIPASTYHKIKALTNISFIIFEE